MIKSDKKYGNNGNKRLRTHQLSKTLYQKNYNYITKRIQRNNKSSYIHEDNDEKEQRYIEFSRQKNIQVSYQKCLKMCKIKFS